MWFKKRVYADAAAATPLSRRSARELVRLLSLYGNAGAIHREGVEAKKALEKARRAIAVAIGAHPDEIVFTASGTEANNLAIQGVIRPMLQKHGEAHAITCAIEHQSVLEPLRMLAREGLITTELGVDAEGLLFPSAVPDATRPNTTFVSVQLVNSEIGAIEPVREIAKEVRRIRAAREGTNPLPIYFHTDASQAPLWIAINVEKLGVDLMTLDAQKVLGPKGIGALYVRRGTPIESILQGGKQERGLRGGTENVPQAGAFATALVDVKKGLDARVRNTAATRDYLWDEIKKFLPDAVLNGPLPREAKPHGVGRVANSLNISIPGLDAEMAVVSLDALGISASTRSACTIGEDEPSHVIQALGVPPHMAGTAIRLSLLPGVSRRDARRIARALFETASRYKRT